MWGRDHFEERVVCEAVVDIFGEVGVGGLESMILLPGLV